MDAARRRLQVTAAHLQPTLGDADVAGAAAAAAAQPSALALAACAAECGQCGTASTCGSGLDFTEKEMAKLLMPDNREHREKLYALFKEPVFRPNFDVTMEEYRELTVKRAARVMQTGLIDVRDHVRDPLRLVATLETLTSMDSSMGVKCGVHFCLFGGCIMHLGTERHQKQFVEGINSWGTPGSFAMTELGHGSNVAGIETVAVYDKTTKEFVITTPNEAAQKYWIGNAARHGQWSAVFAQLIVDGVNQGVHVFVVRIRHPDGTTCANVRLADNGHKTGLLGVDNGRMWFDGVRVPREALLNRYADVDEHGVYRSPIEDKVRRFATMIAPLVAGRVMVAQSANQLAKIGLLIAIRYAGQRRQFDDGSGQEKLISEYITTQKRLYPRLAGVYAFGLAMNTLKTLFAKKDQTATDVKNIHLLASGLKALVTWHKTDTLQLAREVCGGQGFSAYNRIGSMRADSDVDLTYEGDNTVLLQQVTRALLHDLRKGTVADAPAVTANADKVACVDTLLAALKWREVHMLRALGGRLMAAMGAGEPMARAWNTHLDLGVAVGAAHIERFVVENMRAALAKPENQALRPTLTLLATLFAQSRVQADLGYFVSNGGLTADFGAALPDAIAASCRAVHPIARKLTDAFELPPHVIRAPIAADDYIAMNAYDVSRSHPVCLW